MNKRWRSTTVSSDCLRIEDSFAVRSTKIKNPYLCEALPYRTKKNGKQFPYGKRDERTLGTRPKSKRKWELRARGRARVLTRLC